MHIQWKQKPVAERIILSQHCDHELAQGILYGLSLRVGDVIEGKDFQVQALSPLRLPGEGMPTGWICQHSGNVQTGTEEIQRNKRGFSLGWITLSDKGSRGEREDKSGPAIREMLATQLELSIATGVIIPDESQILKATLVDFCLVYGFDMVFTTGGTGVGPRDITPETTIPLLDKRLEGFERIMTATSVLKTPHGMISRAVAGVCGQSLVVNLPGSPKAVRENLLAILPAVKHAVEKIQGDPRDCGQ